jgi:hypothetical protein
VFRRYVDWMKLTGTGDSVERRKMKGSSGTCWLVKDMSVEVINE